MSVLSIFTYGFRSILKEILAGIFVEIEKVVFKCIWKCKGPRIPNIVMKKNGRKEVGGLTLSLTKMYYKAAVIGQHGIGTKVNGSVELEHPGRVPHV